MLKLAAIGFRHGHSWGIVEGLLAQPDVKLVAVYEDHAPLLKRAQEKWAVKSYTDPVELLQQEKPDLVMLCPTNVRKGALVVECFRRGISVFADKPMFTDLAALEEAERLRLAAKRRPALMCAVGLRHSPLHATAARLVRDGAIGRVASVYTRRPHKLSPGTRNLWELDVRDNGGVLIDLGLHDLDLVMYALRSRPRRVVAHQSNLRFTQYPHFIDNGSMTFLFENRAVATIEPNWINPDGSQFHGDCLMLFMGTAGFLTLDETRPGLFLTTLKEKQRPVELMSDLPDLYADFLRQHRGEPYQLEPAEIVEAHRWVIRATQSALQGGQPVEA